FDAVNEFGPQTQADGVARTHALSGSLRYDTVLQPVGQYRYARLGGVFRQECRATAANSRHTLLFYFSDRSVPWHDLQEFDFVDHGVARFQDRRRAVRVSEIAGNEHLPFASQRHRQDRRAESRNQRARIQEDVVWLSWNRIG